MPTRCTSASTNPSLAASIATHLVVANLESRRVVDDPAAVRISSEFRFGGNSGATPAPTVRRERAC